MFSLKLLESVTIKTPNKIKKEKNKNESNDKKQEKEERGKKRKIMRKGSRIKYRSQLFSYSLRNCNVQKITVARNDLGLNGLGHVT